MFIVVPAPLQRVFEGLTKKLHGHVLEGERRTIGETEDVQTGFERAQRRDVVGAENLLRVGPIDHASQIVRRQVVRKQA
jgi:hypothetical protein